mmetsp:Transcript_56360/g.115274  ORF Transcript_56360/g.115274 Transcript_56360/m.115274 type:complete len:162 (+) Transcript_56360:110-595(+)|eukprot:CAMPEP_0181293000 /NCGR_PEP_ID=MMETSP1101-20121128/2821_1 /TAXON_ID=46948 /ORGANISM="Rhodomonas abbreviata, Strain Caron Lab Isolate" /LENGTH=161 /DNA_ID=CAMNT_0023397537 /DNA_START=109 /DNA_END=594 /DNA_ORIENTATION=-
MSSRSSSRSGTSAASGKQSSRPASRSSSIKSDVGAMTLLEKRMMEKKSSTYLLESDIRNIFAQFDRDGNNYLGASDIAAVFRCIGENLEDDLVDELIREADKDGDGQIAYPEFHALVKALEEEGGGLRDPNAKAPPPPKRGPRQASSSDSSSDSESSSGSY